VERGSIDEAIMPWNTRYRLARSLNMLRNTQLEMPWKKHDNIPL
jgi:propionyl-CoA carboxylase beta chain